ncbi:MAG TPA: lysophospholipase [Symbiobacteriaceae bacterium]|nr:lysophospholipase [Symbiobacteriaceae bacterium]
MNAIHENSGYLTGVGGVKLYYRTWMPDEPRASLVLVHGMNEHIGRYAHVAEFFVGQGFAVYGLDHRGYGQSEGVRCHVNRFEEYLEDLHQLVDMAQERGKPFMVGHSLGGLISFRYALAYPETLRALVVSSPLFRQKTEVDAVTRALAPVLSFMLPRLQMKVPFAPNAVCRDPEIVQKYATDPLVGRTATPRWFIESTRAALACHQGLTQGMKLPVLFLQAGDDQLVSPEATQAVYGMVPHEKKAFKLYPGKFHEIFNDPGREAVFQDILNWMQEQELLPTI